MDDTATIVTETDSNYLKNIVEDITDSKLKNGNSYVASLRKIEIEKKQDSLTDKSMQDLTAGGTKLTIAEDVIITTSCIGKVEKTNNKFILRIPKFHNNIQLKGSGLEEIKIEQKNFTNLSCTIDNETYSLDDLPVKSSEWIALPHTEKLFISLDESAFSYPTTSKEQLALAIENAMRKNGKKGPLTAKIQDALKLNNSVTEAPFIINYKGCEWKISGYKNGKKIEKLIQLATTE